MTEAVVGKTYYISLDDCCVSAEFTSELVAFEMKDGYLDRAVFANGVTVYNDHWQTNWPEASDDTSTPM